MGHRGAHRVGERGGGRCPATGAHPGLGPVLGDLGCHHGQVDHLPALLGGSRRPRKVRSAAARVCETVALKVLPCP